MAIANECGTDTTVETVTILPSDLVAFFSVDTTVGCAPFTVDFQQFLLVELHQVGILMMEISQCLLSNPYIYRLENLAVSNVVIMIQPIKLSE